MAKVAYTDYYRLEWRMYFNDTSMLRKKLIAALIGWLCLSMALVVGFAFWVGLPVIQVMIPGLVFIGAEALVGKHYISKVVKSTHSPKVTEYLVSEAGIAVDGKVVGFDQVDRTKILALIAEPAKNVKTPQGITLALPLIHGSLEVQVPSERLRQKVLQSLDHYTKPSV